MAEAAMIEEEAIPEGGIAGFVMSDDDLNALAESEAEKTFGTTGIAEFKDISSRMAAMGRGGDQFIAHLAPGELVVPAPLVENNPELRDTIFNNLREMGIEDPEQYLVGSAANSINPETGLMEFGFLSKIVKKVGKVLKKAAPVVLPLVLSATPLGPVFGAAIGSGIGTLISGGDIGDAAKNALIAGGVGAIGAGLFGGGGRSFGENVSAAISNPGARFSDTLSATGKAFTGGGDFFGDQGLFASPLNRISYGDAATAPTLTSAEMAQATSPVQQMSVQGTTGTDTFIASPDQKAALDLSQGIPMADVTAPRVPGTQPPPIPQQPGIIDRVSDFFFPSNVTPTDVLAQRGITDPFTATPQEYAIATQIAKEQSPGFLRKYGPMAALGGAALYAGGFFDEPEEEQIDLASLQGTTGADLLARDPDRYKLPAMATTPRIPTGSYVVPTRFPRTQTLAEGGEVYPRRNGGIMPNEGIPNEDSVRALLMPGEFVMTTDAVRGAGGGDLSRGIQNMYGIMRNLERRGKATV